MKKKLLIIIPIVAVLLLVGVVAVVVFSGNEFEKGRVVVCDSGAVVFVDENGGFWQMNASSDSTLKGLETGDRVLVLRSTAMAMSYPGQCRVSVCIKLSNGSLSDIPEKVTDELTNIGWLADNGGESPEETTGSAENMVIYPSDNIGDEALIDLINSDSKLFWGLLTEKNVNEIYEYEAELSDDGYIVFIDEDVIIDHENYTEYDSYSWEYNFTHYQGKSAEGLFMTGFTTDSPYARICGVRANAGMDEIRENYESKHFDVSLEGSTLIAKRDGVEVKYVTYDDGEVCIILTLDIGELEEKEDNEE